MATKTKLKPNPGSKSYLLRGVPLNLWKRIKIQSAQQDTLIKDWILDAFKWYLKNSGK